MNNKGYTLVEILGVLVIISLVSVIVIRNFGTTLSISKEETYRIMKNNIISTSKNYLKECDAGTIACNFSFEKNNRFPVSVLKDAGYFQNLKSPIDGKKLDNCLFIEATKENGVIVSNLIDECY